MEFHINQDIISIEERPGAFKKDELQRKPALKFNALAIKGYLSAGYSSAIKLIGCAGSNGT